MEILTWIAFAVACVWVGSVFQLWRTWRKPTALQPPHIAEQPPRIAEEIPQLWRFVRYQGGGTLTSPELMIAKEALEYAKALGSVVYLDREHGIIFYRP